MKKITGQLISTKHVPLSRAAILISRFVAVDDGSSAAVSAYLQRTAGAFARLVHFHKKRSKNYDIGSSPNRKRAREWEEPEERKRKSRSKQMTVDS